MTYDQLRQIRTERRMPVHDFDEGRRMAATAPTRGTKTKAIVRHKYGTSDVLGLEDVDGPGREALRDKGHVQPGQKVLINGAAGGVGTFAVQLAKAFGADVTATTSPRNVDLIRSIGADRVIDYTREDFTKGGQRFDLILDIGGKRSLFACRRALTRTGTYVIVGGPSGRWIRPMDRALGAAILSRFVHQRLLFFIAKLPREDLILLKELLEAGKVTPVIDRTYPLTETPAAIRYLEEGHARGKVVITM